MTEKTVCLEIENYGKILIMLDTEAAPLSVKNFLDYVEQGFYDGLIFHRVIEGFMIQGGDPTGTGYGDPSLKKIKGEFSANGIPNPLSFERGVVGMARSQDPDSASSQFFICHRDAKFLDGSYAAFGRVIEGIEVVDAIAACPKTAKVDANWTQYEPAQKVVIKRAYIPQ